MGRITLSQAAQWCGGQIDPKYAEVTFWGANNDSRKIQPGQLFLALSGARDGHDFIPMALEKGAAAVLCTHCDGDFPAIVVEDVRIALGKIAAGERQRIGMKVVGVTGSVGKSTTKEMISCVLSAAYRVAKTPENHNNDIGMPMAVLSIPEDTEVAVLEMGMNHFREIAYLTEIAKPDLAVIINIGTMHIEHLGSQEGILKAKLEIAEGMRENGELILNGDDAYLRKAPDMVSNPITYFGTGENASVRAAGIRDDDGIAYRACGGGANMDIWLPVEGLHYVPDSLAAVAVGLKLGVECDKIAKALAGFRNMGGRQEIFEANGCTIIKDCYNAGPESMAAALAVLGKRQGRKIAVLGDMLELGVSTQAEHYRIGRIAAENADILLTYGPNGPRTVSGAVTGGMTNVHAFEDHGLLADELKRIVRSGDTLLFKGSHGMHMEIALELFLKNET
jgi:UDP-N-acetylmuramoyl-tripeptide--D-alanyl-D-alanine ligase